MSDTKTNALLEKINFRLNKNNEISEILKENFNVFRILRGEGDEEHLHSAFIYELLNPKGSHDMEGAFLNSFVELVIDDDSFGLGVDAKVSKEKGITGGRIDIYAEGTKGILAIENKIYAGDQVGQLEKYKKHLENTGKNHKLLYLTLDGREASPHSKGELTEGDYSTTSYKDDILKWLEACQKEAAEFPTIRETIKQYTNLIKKLTGGLTNQKMSEEIKNLIKDNYIEAKAIADNVWKAELQVTTDLVESIEQKIKKKLFDSDWEIKRDENLNEKFKGISIHHKKWGEGTTVRLEAQGKMPWNATIYGIVAHKNAWSRDDIKGKLKNINEVAELDKESDFWPCFRWIFNMSATEAKAKLFDTTQRENMATEIADKLINLAMSCKDKLVGIKKIA